MEITDDGAIRLMQAITLNAINDYKNLKLGYEIPHANFTEIDNFFNGYNFQTLYPGLSPEYVKEKIDYDLFTEYMEMLKNCVDPDVKTEIKVIVKKPQKGDPNLGKIKPGTWLIPPIIIDEFITAAYLGFKKIKKLRDGEETENEQC